jgi:hypothetical protein
MQIRFASFFAVLAALTFVSSCGPMNQKPSMAGAQAKNACDPQVTTEVPANGSSASAPPPSSAISYSSQKNFIVSAQLQAADTGSDLDALPIFSNGTPGMGENTYVIRAVSGHNLQPLSANAELIVTQVPTLTTPGAPAPTPYPLPSQDLQRQADGSWTANVKFGRPSGIYEIEIQVTDGPLSDEHILYVSAQ